MIYFNIYSIYNTHYILNYNNYYKQQWKDLNLNKNKWVPDPKASMTKKEAKPHRNSSQNNNLINLYKKLNCLHTIVTNKCKLWKRSITKL